MVVRFRNELSDEEYQALLHEKKGFWGQPKQLKVTVVTLAVAAVVQGWTQVLLLL